MTINKNIQSLRNSCFKFNCKTTVAFNVYDKVFLMKLTIDVYNKECRHKELRVKGPETEH